MRSTWEKAVRTGAPWLLVVGLLMVATGCDSVCGSGCGIDICSPKCAPACETGQCGPFPPEAKPGEAWCCVWVPPVYTTTKERVCVCPEACRKEWVPPVCEKRKRQVCVKEACSTQVCEPACYKDVEECVLVCDAHQEWQKVDCPPTEGDKKDDCWALVTIPAKYEKRVKSVCTKEATTRTQYTPPVYQEVEEDVEVSCGYYKDIVTPAQYEEREVQVCSAPGRWEWRRNDKCAVPTPTIDNPCVPGQPMGGEAPPPPPPVTVEPPPAPPAPPAPPPPAEGPR